MYLEKELGVRLKDYVIHPDSNEQVHVYLDNVDQYVIFSRKAVALVPKTTDSKNQPRFLARQVKGFIEKYHKEESQNGNSKSETTQQTQNW